MTIQLWDVDTGRPLGEPLQGHKSDVLAVGFFPDGSRIVSGSSDKTIRLWDIDAGTSANNGQQDLSEAAHSSIPEDIEGTPLGLHVPGFTHFSLSNDGWVKSFGKLLFWVPPENRHGLQTPRLLLTMPTASSFRATKLDFTHFQCGLSWTSVQNSAS
ncbi:hypothetical protein PIIN_03882 [Serendipita indica DSM 11827]|uniref:Uncharacterized protein n=1 Tax=Serendipita indica (strain DSM 11827) TaxID=1109443 RepID=G4TF49_SERID|nr:hypothetical protein PIIN_03882 [Serendipita indica DSM 11827]